MQEEEVDGARTILGNIVKAIDPEMGRKLTDLDLLMVSQGLM
jgi:hypothetical protein